MGGASRRRGNVAVFIDLENLFGGYFKDVGTVPLAAIVAQLRRLVDSRPEERRTTTIRAYANWCRPDMAVYEDALLSHGIEAMQIFSHTKSVKNAADIQICVDALAEAHDRPWTDTFVIVSGDGGFVPLVRRLRQLDKHVVVASTDHPAAGTVNGLLASAADEYHRLEVGSPAPQPPAAPGAPTLEEYRREILAALKSRPDMRTGGAVNASLLGSHLRQTWPDTTFKDFGSATLGAFIEKHCGLAVHRPVPAGGGTVRGTAGAPQKKATTTAKAAAPSSAERSAYLRAVQKLFLDGPLAAAVEEATKLPLATAGSLVREHVPGTTFVDAGYGKFSRMLQDALVATPYAVTRDEKSAYIVRSH
jgi:uncharacterized LabA/DUF88 family protein